MSVMYYRPTWLHPHEATHSSEYIPVRSKVGEGVIANRIFDNGDAFCKGCAYWPFLHADFPCQWKGPGGCYKAVVVVSTLLLFCRVRLAKLWPHVLAPLLVLALWKLFDA